MALKLLRSAVMIHEPRAPLSLDGPPDTGATPHTPSPPSTRLEGRLLGGKYRVGPLLGSGAMGHVYRASHVELGRTCAVKVIRGGHDDDAREVHDAVARFRVEALAASRLDHPNVLRVLDFGRDGTDGLWYLVTEHLSGEDLVDVLNVEPVLSTERSVAIARQIASALGHAHDRGVVHRDIKPENVRLVRAEADDGRVVESVKLLDFGTAKVDGETADDGTGEPLVVGTPAYMSPEQAAGADVDARSDLYSCGVLIFEMTTGRLPFERSSPIAQAAAHVECRPPAPSTINPSIDRELESIILWCLRKKPAERPQTARELREALDRVVSRSLARRPADALTPTLRVPVSRVTGPKRVSTPPVAVREAARSLSIAAARLSAGSHRAVTLDRRPARRERPRRGPRLLVGVALAALAGSAWMLFGEATMPARVEAAVTAPAGAEARPSSDAPPASRPAPTAKPNAAEPEALAPLRTPVLADARVEAPRIRDDAASRSRAAPGLRRSRPRAPAVPDVVTVEEVSDPYADSTGQPDPARAANPESGSPPTEPR